MGDIKQITQITWKRIDIKMSTERMLDIESRINILTLIFLEK